jgi:two-component system, cell cycle sensor histidine kinase and response regulator CckA
LLNRLQTLNTRMLAVTAALESERVELLKTKDELKQENAIRQESEKALKQSARQYRLLTESIRDVIWTMDMNLRFTYVSPAAVKLQGWTPQEYLNLDLKDILTPTSLEVVMEEISRQYTLGQQSGPYELSSTLELEMRHKNGSTLWTEVTASFISGEGSTPAGILGVTRDITERKKASTERERLLESLERSKKMEALGTLAGGVAHDLNNVLSGIVSYPDLLLMDLPQESPLRTPIETIRESGKRAAAIVQDLLTLARRGVSAPQVLNLNDLITGYLESPEFERLISFHPVVEVEKDLDPGLFNALGSPIHLSKTIMNLVSNAAEAMPQGGIITITTENTYLERPPRGYSEVKEGPYVRLRISDSGVGISSEDLQRIFEPFYTKKKMGRSGTGLGMAVVWGTVQDHHGYIDIRSAEGKGTRIDCYFPATFQKPSDQEKTEKFDALRGKGEKVLIVDDVEEQREIATRIAKQLGYAAVSAANGEEAIHYLKSNVVDLVVLDMIMEPGIDGLETYQRILEYVPHQKAIIASGFAETDRVRQAQELGAGGYIRKPYSVKELGRAIKAELERPPMEMGKRRQ